MTLPEPIRYRGSRISDECTAEVAEGSDCGLIWSTVAESLLRDQEKLLALPRFELRISLMRHERPRWRHTVLYFALNQTVLGVHLASYTVFVSVCIPWRVIHKPEFITGF